MARMVDVPRPTRAEESLWTGLLREKTNKHIQTLLLFHTVPEACCEGVFSTPK